VIIAKTSGETVEDPLEVRYPPLTNLFQSTSQRKTGPKCSIALALRNIPGAIFKMSSCFAFRNLDIIKIESRPATISIGLSFPPLNTPNTNSSMSGSTSNNNSPRKLGNDERPFTQKHWDLIFYIDYEPSENKEVNDAMMSNLSEYCMWIRILGNYQSGLHSLDTLPASEYLKDILSY
jgi:prephenate dehydratase